MKSRHARVIHPFRTSGTNMPGYSRPPEQAPQLPEAPTSSRTPSAPSTAPRRPADARTPSEALAGLLGAAADARPQLVNPRFRSTAGPWIRLGSNQTRVPTDVMVSTSRASDGRHIGVVAYLDSSREAGRVQILVDTVNGIRELVGLMPEQLRQLREVHFGR